MSLRYKGAVLSATPPTVNATAYGSATGIWTMQQQYQYEGSGTWPSPFTPSYVEDVFSTYLYTGTGGTSQTITNGIDLSGEGGMVWLKSRNDTRGHTIVDTVRGANNFLVTNLTDASTNDTQRIPSFTSSGFTLGNDQATNSTYNHVSWTFRKAKKFFDVVTYTGNDTAGRQIAHNLGSVPGTIIVKVTSGGGNWAVYHRSLGNTKYLYLNSTAAEATASTFWNNTSPTSTHFTVGAGSAVNTNGETYVAYLFAHDAGGFGDNGTDNVISCGSFTTDGSGAATLTLNYEPQFIIIKNASSAENWITLDNMRGWTNGSGGEAVLNPNLSDAESAGNYGNLTSTGATWANLSVSKTYIYIAIRRGPMKTPTSGTSVYKSVTRSGTGSTPWVASGAGFPPDMTIMSGRNLVGFNSPVSYQHSIIDRVRRATEHIQTVNTNQEGGGWGSGHIHNMNGYDGLYSGDANYFNSSSGTYVDHHFRRAPGFFDVVCYTGTSANRTVSHNLGVAPELIIVKPRVNLTSETGDWSVYTSPLTATKRMFLNTTDAAASSVVYWNNTEPTSSVFTVGSNGRVNESGKTYVAYLFASAAGVSKVGSYTGTGTTLQINCGFTGGARFVMIKRTDSTGGWYVWDTARGIVSGNDPYLLLNSDAAEVTSTDYIDPYSAGFEISSTAPAAINANGGTFIYLAIA